METPIFYLGRSTCNDICKKQVRQIMNISKALEEHQKTVVFDVISMCDHAKRLEDSGEYAKATEALGDWWQGIGVRPNVNKLSNNQKAAILSRIGALSGWLGSMKQIPASQEKAKDLLSEGADLFDLVSDHQNWAETRSDLAICYWREGAFDEARVILDVVLESGFNLSPQLRGKILLRSVNVEISTRNYARAKNVVNKASSFVEKHGNNLLLGKLSFHRALVLHCQGEDENASNLLLSAIDEYQKAGTYYKKAKHSIYAAAAESNAGNVYRLLEDYKNAHSHFDRAVYLYIKLKDQTHAAQVYENKAQAFLAENKLVDAEAAVRASVAMVSAGDEKSILSESLTTLAIVLSRGGNVDYAIRTFKEAKEIALGVGDKESAGNAILTYIEELQASLTPIVFRKLYLEADELLKESPKISTVNRLQRIARRHFEIGNPESLLKSEKYFNWKNFSLPEAVHAYERELILKALSESGGRVTKAAGLLGVSHQSLSLILHQRHDDLQQHRIQRRPRGSLKVKDH
jgi:tetratricopeptide (TPR) repeat protein